MGQAGSVQIHDYEPGIAPSGLFWTVAVPPEVVQYDLDAGTASFRMKDYATRDYFTFANGVVGGPWIPATVSFDLQWVNPFRKFSVDKPDQQYTGEFTETKGTIEWSSVQDGFSFASDPGPTTQTLFAAVGRERNGVYYADRSAVQNATAPSAQSTESKPGASSAAGPAATSAPANASAPSPASGTLAQTGGIGRRHLWGAAAIGAAELLRRVRDGAARHGE